MTFFENKERMTASPFTIMPNNSFKGLLFPTIVNLESIGFDDLVSKQEMLVPENTTKAPLIWELTLHKVTLNSSCTLPSSQKS